MALETVKAIRAKTPNELIIGPATSLKVGEVDLESNTSPIKTDLKFFEECFKAGLLNYWDAVSVHPYRDLQPEITWWDYNNFSIFQKLVYYYQWVMEFLSFL
jgi:hypothetical protein